MAASGRRGITRRQALRRIGGAAALPLLTLTSCGGGGGGTPLPPPTRLTDEELLDYVERTAFQFFWDQTNPTTGQTKDRARANTSDNYTVSSIASTGYGLGALCVADYRGWRSTTELRERARTTLRYLANSLEHVHGFFFHLVDVNTGARIGDSELSSVDSTILLCGVLMARAHFNDQEITDLANTIYGRFDWQWMLDGGAALSMGWKPESGFLPWHWDTYSELMMIYLLAIGSPTFPIPADSWHAFARPSFSYAGIDYISNPYAPLFIHQYSHAWFDFRGVSDSYTNYFDNSVKATRAHKQFCLDLRNRFPRYTDNLWGITASDSATGYQPWGGPPEMGRLDGSVVPCAAAGSLPFLKTECLAVLRTIYEQHAYARCRYGFVDAFNPHNAWVNPDVIGINLGTSLLMAENARTGFVWQTFMRNDEARAAMQVVGFR